MTTEQAKSLSESAIARLMEALERGYLLLFSAREGCFAGLWRSPPDVEEDHVARPGPRAVHSRGALEFTKGIMELSPESRFNAAMHELYGRIVRETQYTPTVFFRMIEQHGGLEAARRRLKPDADFFSYGFEHLCQMCRGDLTMEALILSLDYRDQLFTARDLAIAGERLAAARKLYPPPA
jgi:hypothetical protein